MLQRKTKQRNYDPNKARKEQRKELQRLQQEATDLELTLHQLRSVHSERALTAGTPANSSGGDNRFPAVWEDICNRQVQRRLKAERENIRLKKRFVEEQEFIKSLEKVIRKRVLLQDAKSGSFRTRRTEIPADFVTSVVNLIFEQLLEGVQVSYQEVDTIFEGSSSGNRNFMTREPLLRDEMDGMYLELFDNQVVPFSIRETGEAWWRRWHNYKGQAVRYDVGDTIAEKYGLEMADDKSNTTARFYVQQVLRRHEERDRIVIVWHAHIEPLEFDAKQVSGIQFLEKGYVLITPSGEGSTTEGNSSARVSTCYVIIPNFTDPNQNDVKATALTKFVVDAMAANISTSTEMIENLLVDRMLQQRRSIL